MAYAVAWTQHTIGVQIIRAAGILQQLLGNIGRPGGGILALRGHASIQGSTDNPTLYHSITGYMSHPSTLKRHETLKEYLATETVPTSYYSNQPKFMVSYLKALYGNAATRENDFGYAWHPRISGDHSHIPMMVNMADGKVRGMYAIGQNPAVGGQNAGLQRRALANLDWLVIRDYFETETASFWYASPEVRNGQLSTADIKTEIFFLPAAHNAEGEGSFTNTHRLLQWHEKAADPPGDARTDLWFTYQLGKRLKQLYAGSTLPRDQGFLNLTWDYEPQPTETLEWRIKDEPSGLRVLKEINGYDVATGNHLSGFGALKDDGSTACGNWIYSGVFPAPDRNLAASRKPDNYVSLGWGFNWPANRHIMYNRASARPDGQPWSDRKRYVWWDPAGGADQKGAWVGYDVPDFTVNKAPNAPPDDNGVGLAWQAGTDPFIMHADGKAWLFAPTGLLDGPLPAHYEPAESPVQNALYPRQQSSPVYKYFERPDNQLAQVGDPRYPYALTTYRLTEHYLSGTMSRWLPWLAELQPELFIELSPELAREKGIANLDMVRVSTPRASVNARALVTGRLRPFTINGQLVHQVGMPWHWGCKACEVACKEWNQLPAELDAQHLRMSGNSYDNTRTLSGTTFRHVKFIEQFDITDPNRVGGRWLMMSDVCKHCVQAGCLEVCPTGAIIRTEFDTVVIQSDVCNGCRACIAACPFGVIDMNPAAGTAQKCTLCYDRMQVGLEPACAKACPTDSIQFGPIAELRTRAQKRVTQLQAQGEKRARLYGDDPNGPLGGLNSFYLLVDEPEVYGLPKDPKLPSRHLKSSGALSAVSGAVLGLVAIIGLRKRRMDEIEAGGEKGREN